MTERFGLLAVCRRAGETQRRGAFASARPIASTLGGIGPPDPLLHYEASPLRLSGRARVGFLISDAEPAIAPARPACRPYRVALSI